MNLRTTTCLLLIAFLFSFSNLAEARELPETIIPTDILISGVVDGPLPGGLPKAIEFYVVNDIANLSIYGFGSANNGGGSDGQEFTFPAVSATAGSFIYLASESTGFTSFFGFTPDYTSGAASINGDDAIELFMNGAVIDVFGDINTDGTGQPWEYMDGWAYRVDETDADGSTYTPGDWFLSGPNALDGETSNAGAATPFPIGTYMHLPAGDLPPSLSSSIPADAAVNVANASNIQLNFNELVAVTGTWFDITCSISGNQSATVSPASPASSFTLDPDMDFSNADVCTVTVFAAFVQDQDGTLDNMVADASFSFTVINPSVVLIHEVQGFGGDSPLLGQQVSVEAIVTAVGADQFAIQEEDIETDADPVTSEGIIVFMGAAPGVAVGDLVEVAGEVVEFFEMTQIASPSVTITSSGNALPTPVVFDASNPTPNAPGNLEQYEGMLVTATDAFVTSPTDQFGDAVLSMNGRAFREPGIEQFAGAVVWDGNPELFELNPDYFGLANLDINAGSTVTTEGVVGFSFGDYVIWPTSVNVTTANPAVPVRAATSSEGTVGSLNVLRLFNDVDDNNGDPVPTTQEYQDRLSKFSLYIRTLMRSPDILGIQEIENLSTMQDLAAKIQSDDPSVVYTAHLIEGNDVGGIDVGYLTRSTVGNITVTQLGANEMFLNPITNQMDILHDRPPLLLEGEFTLAAAPISVLVVHQRSLGGITGTQAQRVKVKRSEQAKSVATMAQARQADNLIILGDFNAFEFSDGFVDVLGQITGTPDPDGAEIPVTPIVTPVMTNQVLSVPAADRYSFIFSGSSQALDHFVTNASIPITPPLGRAAIQAGELAFNDLEFARGNVDAYRSNETDATTPLRSSDHDGLVGYFQFVTLPVELASFETLVEDGEVNLVWSTATEENNAGFEIEYSLVSGKDQVGNWRSIGFVEGHGTSTEAHDYSFRVSELDPGFYEFRLKQIDFDGAFEYSSTVKADIGIPGEFVIRAAYPNPFNPSTTIQFAVAERQEVTMSLYNSMGELMQVAYDGVPVANSMQTVQIDASGLASGTYFVRVQGATFAANQKVTLIK